MRIQPGDSSTYSLSLIYLLFLTKTPRQNNVKKVWTATKKGGKKWAELIRTWNEKKHRWKCRHYFFSFLSVLRKYISRVIDTADIVLNVPVFSQIVWKKVSPHTVCCYCSNDSHQKSNVHSFSSFSLDQCVTHTRTWLKREIILLFLVRLLLSLYLSTMGGLKKKNCLL